MDIILKNKKIMIFILVLVILLFSIFIFKNNKSKIKESCTVESNLCVVIYENNNYFGSFFNIATYNNYEVRVMNKVDNKSYQSMVLPRFCRDSFGIKCVVYETLNPEKVKIEINEPEKSISINSTSAFGRDNEFIYNINIAY